MRRIRAFCRGVVAVLAACLVTTPALAANSDSAIRGLKQRTASMSLFTDINAQGQAVGFGNTALLWDRGWQSELIPLRYWSEAAAINDQGVVGGMVATRAEAGRWPGRAFRWSSQTGLAELDAGGRPWSMVRGLNNTGEAVGVGVAVGPSGAVQSVDALIWAANGSVRELPGLTAGDAVALAINNNTPAIVVGAAQDASGMYRAVRWSGAQGAEDLQVPRPLPNTHSIATSVNERGQVVGWVGALPAPINGAGYAVSRDPDGLVNSPSPWLYSVGQASGEAFLWDPTAGTSPLGTLPGHIASMALGINNAGVVVGYSEDPGGRKWAISYEPGVGLRSLSERFGAGGVSFDVATAINEDGVITAFGRPAVAEGPMDLRPFVLVPAGAANIADLQVQLTAPSVAAVGGTVQLQAVVRNQGPDDANASLTLTLPNGLTVGSLPAQCQANPVLRCDLGLLRPLSASTLAIPVTVRAAGRWVVEALARSDALETNYLVAARSVEVLVQGNSDAAPRYTITDLGPLGDWNPAEQLWFAQGYGLNDKGEVVGRVGAASFKYSGTATAVFGEFCPSPRVDCRLAAHWQELSAINNDGIAVGMQHVGAADPSLGQAFWMDASGTRQMLPLQPAMTRFSLARDINATGEIVGYGDVQPVPDIRAFIWSPQRGLTALPSLGGDTYALGVNDRGVVVGASRDSSGVLRVFRWDRTGGIAAVPVLATRPAVAVDINNRDQVVGWVGEAPQRTDRTLMFGSNPNAGPSAWYYSELEATGNAFVVDAGRHIDLGPGVALSVNENGQVVGSLREPRNVALDATLPYPRYTERQRAFVYDIGSGSTYDLTSRLDSSDDWQLRVAHRINNVGQIVGWGERGNDRGLGAERTRLHAFLLTPVATGPRPSIRFEPPSGPSSLSRELASPVSLPFVVENWTMAPGGRHLHWFVDGQLQAEHGTLAPLDLSSLADGQYVIRAVLADGTHALTDYTAQVSVNLTTLMPEITITSPQQGAALPATGGSVTVDFSVANWTMSEGGKHIYVQLDGREYARVASANRVALTGLAAGSHEVTLQPATADGSLVGVAIATRFSLISNSGGAGPTPAPAAPGGSAGSGGGGGAIGFVGVLWLLWVAVRQRARHAHHV